VTTVIYPAGNNLTVEIEKTRLRFEQHLYTSFENEPIEDGVSHPAEQIIQENLEKYPTLAPVWLEDIFNRNLKINSTISEGILRCIGRLNFERTADWKINLVKIGLESALVGIRESALRALERWGGEKATELIRLHILHETNKWLKNYANAILSDLTE
jgi:hypothetical protein